MKNYQYKLISWRKRLVIRSLARDAWVASNGDVEKATAYFSQEIRTNSIIISILIGLSIRLAIELFKLWLQLNIRDPGPIFRKGEPGQ